jgi:hypothetical protein
MTTQRLLTLHNHYLRLTAALFLLASLAATALLLFSPPIATSYDLPLLPLRISATLLALTMAFLSFVRIVTLRTPHSPFYWKINAVLLGLDLSTLLLWPLALPLLYRWLQPTTRAHFHTLTAAPEPAHVPH